MDLSSGLPKCCICTDSLDDPRQLPCGHCYCGPHKTCLEFLKVEGIYKCAICKYDHQINIAELKPLYGVRDFLQNQQNAIQDDSIDGAFMLFCNYHPEKQVKFWCTNCENSMCVECTDCDIHSDHLFISFSKNFKRITESQLKRASKNVSSWSSKIETKLGKLKERAKNIEIEIENLEEKKAVRDEQLIKLKQCMDETDCVIDSNFFQWIYCLGTEMNYHDDPEPSFASSLKDAFIVNSIATQTPKETRSDGSTQCLVKLTTETQIQTEDESQLKPTIASFCLSEYRSSQVVRPKTNSFAKSGKNQNIAAKKACENHPYNSVADNLSSTKLVRMDMFRQNDENNRPEGDFLYDNHYLSCDNITVDSVKIDFPFYPNLSHTEKLVSDSLINRFCIFQLTLRRQKNNKLNVDINVRGAEPDKLFTVLFKRNDGSDYWIWKNNKLVDSGPNNVAAQRSTKLDWGQLRVMRPGNSAWTISASVNFVDLND